MGSVDVAVVGAGPSGCSAAIHLARAGWRVTVIDKATFPRDKCCGDGLTTAALRRLEALGLDAPALPSWRVVDETTWRSPSGHTIDLPVTGDGGVRIAVARRSELDAALVTLARASGVNVLEGSALKGVQIDGERLSLTADGHGTIEADYVIAADGMWSPTRRFLGRDEKAYLGDIHAFRQYFTGVTGSGRDRLFVSFERELLPGYLWSFPLGDGSANVGFGITRKEGESVSWMKSFWPELLSRPHIREVLGEGARPEGPHKAWPIPARIQGSLLSGAGGRVLFVGDAARTVDPLTGEGIGQALETGELAARAILRSGTSRPRQAARLYKNSVRFGMAVDNAFARSLAGLVTHEAPARAVIRMAPKGPWRGRYAVKWVFEDNPRAALLTPWRWPQRFATKGGAYK